MNDFIAKIADIKPSNIGDDDANCYHSKIDGSYLTRVGMEDSLKFLKKRGITEQIQNRDGISEHTANIGFNPVEQKWFGWSHRAIYGFGIGSEVKKGNCAYHAPNKEDFLQDMLRFWSIDEEFHKNTTAKHTEKGVQVSWEYTDTVPNEKLRGTIGGTFCTYPIEYGRGEWKAETLEDAKKMACDFASGVS